MTTTLEAPRPSVAGFLSRLGKYPRLNSYLHRYVKLRGVRWTRYAKVSKLKEEVRELLEAIADYEAEPTEEKHLHLQEESADVLFCLLGISEKAGFDLHDAVEHKIRKDTGRNGKKHG